MDQFVSENSTIIVLMGLIASILTIIGFFKIKNKNDNFSNSLNENRKSEIEVNSSDKLSIKDSINTNVDSKIMLK